MSTKHSLLRKHPFFSSNFPLNIEHHCLNDKPTGQYSLHWHNFFEIEFVVNGNGEHSINGVNHPLARGWLYLVKPSDRHSLISNPNDSLDIFTIQFDSSIVNSQTIDRLLEAPSPLFNYYDGEDFDFLYHYLTQMLRYFQQLVDESKTILISMLSLLCLIICKNISSAGSHTTIDDLPFSIQKAVTYIMLNLKGNLTIKSIANTINLSPNYLGFLFREHMGMSVNAYVNKLRMERALEYLRQTDLTTKEIAQEVGFSSASYFVQKYHEYYGVSPSSVRSNVNSTAPNAIPESDQ